MTDPRLFPEAAAIAVPADTRPTLAVVIHTEEEFDWGAPFERTAQGVEHMRHMDRAQEIFDAFRIVPNYVIGYPTATEEAGYALLKRYAEEGRALIGAHLHPWVCPPFEEEVNTYNSYPGNLPPALERAKLETLTAAIGRTFGARPATYLAGRYGFGPHTAGILEELGYLVDISVAAGIDYRADGGPDYSGFGSAPFWFGSQRRLLGLPGTGGFVGALHAGGPPLYALATDPRLRRARLPGVLSRLRLLERIRLSPEDYGVADLQRLTRALLARGVRYFVFSFHSPSVHPGYTPYVRDYEDLQRFLRKCRDYFQFFFAELGGVARTPLEIRAELEGSGDTVPGTFPRNPAES